MPRRPLAISFDALATLLSLEPIRLRLEAVGLPPHALKLWYARTLRDGFALTAAGACRPYREVATDTLVGLFAEHRREPVAGPILDAFAELSPTEGAPAALDAVHAAGLPAYVLTNGSEGVTAAALRFAGLYSKVKRIISIDEAGAWKPAAATYLYAAKVAGVEPGRLALVSAHAWDCHGASRAGLVSGWVSRTEKRFNPAMCWPDMQADTLGGVVAGLLALPPD